VKRIFIWTKHFAIFFILANFGQICFAQTSPVLSRYTLTNKGWAETQGGTGGQLIKVTTLASSGPGSLKEALAVSGKRIIVFEVGGVIDLQGQSWKVKEPNLTIAGQTAPSPGITLIKGELEIETSDVIVQHLMFRPGEFGRPKRGGGDHDGLNTTNGAKKVICDEIPYGKYEYKVYLRAKTAIGTRESFNEWSTKYNDKIKVSKSVMKWLNGGSYYYSNPYIHVADGPMLSMVYLFLGNNVQRAEHFITRSCINTITKQEELCQA
jgi:hypothetical protein